MTEQETHQISYNQQHDEIDMAEHEEYQQQQIQQQKENLQQVRREQFRQTIPRDWRPILEQLLPTGSLQNDLCSSFQVPVPE